MVSVSGQFGQLNESGKAVFDPRASRRVVDWAIDELVTAGEYLSDMLGETRPLTP